MTVQAWIDWGRLEIERWASDVKLGEYLYRYADTTIANPWAPVLLDACNRVLRTRGMALCTADGLGMRVAHLDPVAGCAVCYACQPDSY